MFYVYSPIVSFILDKSKLVMSRLYNDSLRPEHVAVCMLSYSSTLLKAMFDKLGADIAAATKELEEKAGESGGLSAAVPDEVPVSDELQKILMQAVAEARADSTANVVKEEHLLLAILNRNMENNAKDILNKFGVNYETVTAFIADKKDNIVRHREAKDSYSDDDELLGGTKAGDPVGAGKQKVKEGAEENSVLKAFSIDLTDAARKNLLDPVVGRGDEIMRVTEILCRRRKNNPVIIGEPGVGKSAVVEGLAQLIADKKTAPVLHNKRVLMLDMTLLVAGTKYRGQFEERMKKLIQEIEADPNVIVFIDEIHTIIGAGDVQNGMDAANILKPALARGAIQCIGATTESEYAKTIEKDGALERRFQKVLLAPPTQEQTLEILHNLAPRYEKFHNVAYSDEALAACVNLTERYVTDRRFPDKAIDAMDEVGAKVRLRNNGVPEEIAALQEQIRNVDVQKREAVSAQDFELAAAYRDRQVMLEKELDERLADWDKSTGNKKVTVTADDVAETVAVMTGIPVQRIATTEQERLINMAAILKEKVIAQDKAVERVVKAIQRNRVGLRSKNHPVGVFLFLGPTGVGKTHLAKQLALEMFGTDDALVRIDMSEYTESFNTSRLIGAPPGYVGYDEGGQLTEVVRRHPYSIVLLDEIEKAHPNVYNMLLQVLDEGRLTDGNGRKVDFRNTIIIMTSNTGTRQLKEFGRGIGFEASAMSLNETSESHNEYARGVIQKALSKQFAPEFLNRLDEIITFDQLSLDAIKKIVDIELGQLFARIEEMGYKVEISDAAKTFVAEKGFDIQNGARPLKRSIQANVEDPVCETILSGRLRPGDTIKIVKERNKDRLAVEVAAGNKASANEGQ
ncbi:MAG: ATP-dependent Clp protease ATP-binding subunit [Prevotella sp.]|nr:ATP-dependent Clp protease ATP-binding subunit [Prevotella sp.]